MPDPDVEQNRGEDVPSDGAEGITAQITCFVEDARGRFPQTALERLFASSDQSGFLVVDGPVPLVLEAPPEEQAMLNASVIDRLQEDPDVARNFTRDQLRRSCGDAIRESLRAGVEGGAPAVQERIAKLVSDVHGELHDYECLVSLDEVQMLAGAELRVGRWLLRNPTEEERSSMNGVPNPPAASTCYASGSIRARESTLELILRYEVLDQVVNVLRCFLDPLLGRDSRVGEHRMVAPSLMAWRQPGETWSIRGRYPGVEQPLQLTPERTDQLRQLLAWQRGAALVGDAGTNDLRRRTLLAMTQWGSATMLPALEVQLALFLAPIDTFFNKSGSENIGPAIAILSKRPPPSLPGINLHDELKALYEKRNWIMHEGLRNDSADANITEGDVYIAKRLSNQVIMNVLEFCWDLPNKKKLIKSLKTS